MKKWRKAGAVVLAGTIAALTVTGCMPVEEAESTPAATTEAESGSVEEAASDAAQTDSGEQITLRMSWWGNDSRHKATLEAIEAYQKKNPNIKIDAEYGGMSGYREKYVTQLAGGQGPDIFAVDTPWVADFYQQGDFFVDLYEYQDLVDISQFDSDFLNGYVVQDGKLTGLPAGINSQLFTVDDRIADEFGVELDGPWNWEKLHDVGVKIHEANPEQYFLATDSIFIITHILKPYLSQLTGSPVIGDDYKPAFTKEQLVQVLGYVRSLYEDSVVEPCQDADLYLQATATNPKWLAGDFKAIGCWLTSMSHDQAYPDNIYSIEYPQVEGAENTGILVRPVQIYSVPKSSKHIEEAVKFLDYLLNDPEAAQIQGYIRSYPASKTAVETTSKLNLGIPAYDKAFEYNQAHAGIPENVPSSNSEIEQAFRNMVENLAYGTDTTENIAEQGIAELEEILGRIQQ